MSYIEHEALREELRHCCIVAFDERSGEPYVIDIPQLLRRTTVSADVAPVVHGEWTERKDPYDRPFEIVCSVCGEDPMEDLDAEIYSAFTPKYCPNCGALMDGGEKHE